MKAKNILMTLLLAVGAIAAKASGFPPELALVSQPVMVYNHSSITVYYDVENIGDYTYRGYVSIFLDPDYGYIYDEEYVKVRPGRIKRIALEIPLRRIDRRRTFTIMPYYELGDELYSFTTFEYFDPICFYWDGPRTEHWVVITVPPCIRYYHRPGSYRYYYDGFRPPMHAHGPGMPPPMDPMHHTYGYHYSIGGYPATHPEWSNNNEMPKPNNNVAPSATVRPDGNAGSMSSASNSGGNNTPVPNSGSSSGRVSRPSGSNSSGTVRPSSSSSGTSRPSSGSSSNVSRPSSNTGSSARPSGTGISRPSSGNSSSSVSRPSGTSSSSSARPSSTSSSNRSSSSSSSVRPSTSNTRSSATNSSSSSTSRSSSATNGSRSGSSAGRR